VSAISRKHTEAREVLLPKILRDVAVPRVQGEVSAMVMGHVHEPYHVRTESRDFLIIGDWIDNLTHVRLEDGQFGLYRLVEGSYRKEAAEPWPPA
jgi:UDP-2,3-diacylglucosamine pyrophosphatase LpxH